MIDFRLYIASADGREYILSVRDEKHLWISDGTGEGGAFKIDKFFEAVDKFYKENF